MTVIILTLLAITAFVVAGIYKEASRHGPHKIIWRWFSGHTWHGQHYTNATWTKAATRVHTSSGTAARWHRKPRLWRATIRTSSTIAALAIGYGLIVNRSLTIIGLITAGITALGLSLYVGIRKARNHQIDKTVKSPLAAGLATIIDHPVEDIQAGIVLSPKMATIKKGPIGTIELPPKFRANPQQRAEVEHFVTTHLAVDADLKWKTRQTPQMIQLNAAPPLPTQVRMRDYLDKIRELGSHEVAIGIDAEGELKTFNMASEDPHMAAQAKSRRGKTRLLLLLAVQVLMKGGSVTVIDPKSVGVDEALAGVPNTRIACDPGDIQEMWGAISDFEQTMQDRREAYKKDRTLEFPRELLIIDEGSQFAAQSKNFWTKIKPKGASKIPLPWEKIQSVVWQGAQFNMSVIIFAQRIDQINTAGTLAGMGTRLLAGYSKADFYRLTDNGQYIPSPKARGRFVHYDGENATRIQCLLEMDDNVLRELAMEGQKAFIKTNVLDTQTIN